MIGTVSVPIVSIALRLLMETRMGLYLNISGISGSSKAAGFVGQIELTGFRLSGPTAARTASGSGAVGRPDETFVEFTKLADQASPKLLTACFTKEHLSQFIFSFTAGTSTSSTIIQVITLTTVMVTSFIQTLAQIGPEDSIALSFGKIDYQFLGKSSGQMVPPSSIGHNI